MEKERKNLSQILNTIIETRGVNASKLAELTGVPERFLENIINEDFEKLPPAPYVRGYLLKLAEVLNTDGEALWQKFKDDAAELKKSGREDRLPANRFEPRKFNQNVILAGLAFFLLVGYLGFRTDDFLGKPELYLASPSIDAVVNEPRIVLRGQIEPEDSLEINGETAYVEKDGTFQIEFFLQPGINNIEFAVKKFLGRKITINRRVIYNPPPAENLNN